MPVRRDFLKISGLAGLAVINNNFMNAFANNAATPPHVSASTSIIGQYGEWAAGLRNNKLPSHSFLNSKFKNTDAWRTEARELTISRMGVPDIGSTPKVKVIKQYNYDGLHVEELSWQLPYGRATNAILLKPENATGRLPGILAFHDHSGDKYFGTRKITKTSEDQHPMMAQHQTDYYSGKAWANEIAKKGYVVLVPDAFTFASRRVMMQDVPEELRKGLTDENPENPANIDAYNKWAFDHEHVMAKSLFCAGTTWPAVFFAEDRIALDILCARNDVDKDKIGCGGLSGGGIRTDYMAGLDPRIKCSVTVGFMSTWKDFLLNKSYTHTWMTYVRLLPNELDYPEILGLRAPLPSLVLFDKDDFLFTMPEMKASDELLKKIYAKAGAPDSYKGSFYPGPHKFDAGMQQEAFQWFDKWLKS